MAPLEQAVTLAQDLMREHGLLDANWILRVDRSKGRAGSCNYHTKTISISKYLIDTGDLDALRNTVLHEIAHALVGAEHGHNEVWRSKALEIGCNGHTCYTGPALAIEFRWRLTCACGTCNIGRHVLKKDALKRAFCKQCKSHLTAKDQVTGQVVALV